MPEYTHVYIDEGWTHKRYFTRLTINTRRRIEGYMIEIAEIKKGRVTEQHFSAVGEDSVKFFNERAKRLLVPYTATPRQVNRQTTDVYAGIEPTYTTIYQRQMGRGIVGWNDNPAREVADVYYTHNVRTGRTYPAGQVDQGEWYRMAYERIMNTTAMQHVGELDTPQNRDRREMERQRIEDVTRRANERARLWDMYNGRGRGGNWR